MWVCAHMDIQIHTHLYLHINSPPLLSQSLNDAHMPFMYLLYLCWGCTAIPNATYLHVQVHTYMNIHIYYIQYTGAEMEALTPSPPYFIYTWPLDTEMRNYISMSPIWNSLYTDLLLYTHKIQWPLERQTAVYH